MADQNDINLPVMTSPYADAIDTLRENIKRVKAGALPIGGGAITGPITVTGNVTASGTVQGATVLGNSIIVKAPDNVSDATLSFQDDAGGARGSVKWKRSSNTIDVAGPAGASINLLGAIAAGAGPVDASAVLAINSTTKGLLLPRMTTAQRDAIPAPATGLAIYNTTNDQLEQRKAGGWAGSGLSAPIPPSVISPFDTPFRNKLINGNFDMWQRAASIPIAASTQTLVGYGPDRWCLTTGAAQACTIDQLPGLSSASAYSCRIRRNAGQTGLANIVFEQAFELNNIIPLRGKTVTLSFTVKAGNNWSAPNAGFGLYCGTGLPARRAIGVYTGETTPLSSGVVPSLTVTRYSFTSTVPVPANTTQMSMLFSWAPVGTAGADDSIILDDLQLEIGSAASDFESVPFDVNLARCRRYYQKSYAADIQPGTASTAGTVTTFISGPATFNSGGVQVNLPVEMRAAPTVVAYSPNTGAGGVFRNNVGNVDIAATVGPTNGNGFFISGSVTASATFSVSAHYTANAEI